MLLLIMYFEKYSYTCLDRNPADEAKLVSFYGINIWHVVIDVVRVIVLCFAPC